MGAVPVTGANGSCVVGADDLLDQVGLARPGLEGERVGGRGTGDDLVRAGAGDDLDLLAGPRVLDRELAGRGRLDRGGDELAVLDLHVDLVIVLDVDGPAAVPVGRPGRREPDDAVVVLGERLVHRGRGGGRLLHVGLGADGAAEVGEAVGVDLVRLGERDQVALHLGRLLQPGRVDGVVRPVVAALVRPAGVAALLQGEQVGVLVAHVIPRPQRLELDVLVILPLRGRLVGDRDHVGAGRVGGLRFRLGVVGVEQLRAGRVVGPRVRRDLREGLRELGEQRVLG